MTRYSKDLFVVGVKIIRKTDGITISYLSILSITRNYLFSLRNWNTTSKENLALYVIPLILLKVDHFIFLVSPVALHSHMEIMSTNLRTQYSNMRFEVLTAVNTPMLVFRAKTRHKPHRTQEKRREQRKQNFLNKFSTIVSKEHTASIFSLAEVV
jgi:hypothetical protein